MKYLFRLAHVCYDKGTGVHLIIYKKRQLGKATLPDYKTDYDTVGTNSWELLKRGVGWRESRKWKKRL